MKISLCMIIKDEEAVLKRCLDSVKGFVDEIVIADTGSTDNSREIAREYTNLVYPFVWIDDFAAARNFAFSKATGDYLLWLDADDVIPEHSQTVFAELRKMLEQESPDFVMCPYDIAFDEAGKPTSTFYRERILKRSEGFVWLGRVHECIVPHGKIARCDFRVTHLGSKKERGMRNLHIYQKWAGEEPLSPRDKFYYGRELFYHRLYAEAIAVLDEMIAGEGWYVNKIDACRTKGFCHLARGERGLALEAFLKSFCFGEPRAFVCCEIGRLFREDKKFKEAAFWYESALACKDHSAEGDFEEPSCRSLTPLLELVCCYYSLGEHKKALLCHKKTEELAPHHPSVVYNRAFFEKKL